MVMGILEWDDILKALAMGAGLSFWLWAITADYKQRAKEVGRKLKGDDD